MSPTIADLLLRPGEIAKERALSQGAATASAIQDIGAVPGQMLSLRRLQNQDALQAQDAEQRRQLNSLEINGRQQTLANQQKAQQTQDILAHVQQEAFTTDANGNAVLDDAKVQAGLAKVGRLDLLPALKKSANDLTESNLKVSESQGKVQALADAHAKVLASQRNEIASSPAAQDPGSFMVLVKASGLDDAEKRQILADVAQHPQSVTKYLAQWKLPEKPVDVAAGASLMNPTTGAVIATAPTKAPTGLEESFMAQYAKEKGKPVGALTAAEQLDARAKFHAASREPETAVDLSPEGLKVAAHQYAMTGQLPPMGMGKQGAAVRTKIINQAADEYKHLDLPSQIAAYKASQASLGKLQQQRDALGAFEETALKNLDVFLTAAKNVPDSGSPWVNKPLREVSEKLFGGPDLTAYNTARRTVIPEFAKILANPGLSGQLSDSARREVEDVVSGNATLKQTLAAARVLKQDVENRRTSYDDQIAAIQKRIATPPGGAKPATAASVPANVAAALKSAGPGKHTLSDGSVWLTDAQGNVTASQ